MREQATTRKFSEPTLVSTTPAEPAARPKVLRRPAQFAPGTAIAPITPAPAAANISEKQEDHAQPSTSWQDDGRFAVTLLGIIVLVNVIVVSWLGFITPAAPKPVVTVQQQPSSVPTLAKQRAVSVFSHTPTDEDYERNLPPLNSNVDVHVLDSSASIISQ